MSGNFALLVREVERLITAPYVPSLQNLNDIVQQVPTSLISLWTVCNPCQVGDLVDVLVDGLCRSKLALRLICVLVPAVRNALLERHPAILDSFLQKAVDDGDCRYSTACIALTSSALPEDFVAPARLADFVTKLIDIVGESPRSDTIRPLYQLMTGLQASLRILYDVPDETMSRLQIELTKTLRNLDDHMGNLFCLATFARIASPQRISPEIEHGSEHGSEHGPELTHWQLSINHFFGPKRGLKTLDLVVLRVILACSSSCNSLTAVNAAESVRLAIEICDTVHPDQKRTWITGNASKIAKLGEKVIREGIDPKVQIMGALFLVSLLPATALSPQIPALGLESLLSGDSSNVLEMIPSQFIPRLVEANVICSGKNATGRLFDYVFAALKTGPPAGSDDMAKIHIANSIVHSMQQLNSQHLTTTVAEAIAEQDKKWINQVLVNFPKQSSQSQCKSSLTCHTAICALENQLLVDLFGLYCAISPSRSVTETKILNLFMTQIKKDACQTKCPSYDRKPFDLRAPFSSLEIGEDSSNRRTRDWRTGMAETLMLNARSSQDTVMKKIEEVCQDLEQRCYNTEAPLRAVEEERDQMSSQASQLKSQNEQLEIQLQQAMHTIAELQQNMSQLEQHAESASLNVGELSASLQAARHELEEQRRSSVEDSQSEREKARTRELDLIASITEKDDHIEELHEEVRQQKEVIYEMQTSLRVASREKAVCLEDTASLRQEITRIQELMEANKAIIAQKDEEVEQLLADKETTRSEMEALQTRLDNEVSESDRLRSTLQHADETFRAETDSLRKQNESELSQVVAECAKRKQENKALQATMQASAASATKELQTKDKRIHHLEKKIQSLRDERASKAREFSEAQQHIGRLMDVMGFQAKPAEPTASSRHKRSNSTFGSSQVLTMRRKADVGEDENTQIDAEDSFWPNTPQPSGRSPKRPRSNPGSLVLSPESPQVPGDQGLRESTMRSHTKQRQRKVLGDADQNTQSSSQNSRASRNSQLGTFQESQYQHPDENRLGLEEIDLDTDLEFSKDFIFTSTSHSEVNNDSLTQEPL